MSNEKKTIFLDVDALGEAHSPELFDIKMSNKVYKVGQRNVVLLGIVQSYYQDIADKKDKGAEYYYALRTNYCDMTIAILKEFNEEVDGEKIHEFGKNNIEKLQEFVHWYNDEFQQRFLEKARGKAKAKTAVTSD